MSAESAVFADLCRTVERESKKPPREWNFFPGPEPAEDIYKYTADSSTLLRGGSFQFTSSNPSVNAILELIDGGFGEFIPGSPAEHNDECNALWRKHSDRGYLWPNITEYAVHKLRVINATIEAKRQLISDLGGVDAAAMYIESLSGLRLYINAKLVMCAKTHAGKVVAMFSLVPDKFIKDQIERNLRAENYFSADGVERRRKDMDRRYNRYNGEAVRQRHLSEAKIEAEVIERFRKRHAPVFDFLAPPMFNAATTEGVCMFKIKGVNPLFASASDVKDQFVNAGKSLVESVKSKLVASMWVPSPDEFTPSAVSPPPQRRERGGIAIAEVCCVCMERPPRVVCVPCGHLVMCERCSAGVVGDGGGACPVCRVVTTSVVTVFT